jgi:large subunit ribosomal protein L35
MKNKTNSGAKKRYKVLKSGKIKRKQTRKRHLLSPRSPKAKRQLSKTAYVNDANYLQVQRLLVF